MVLGMTETLVCAFPVRLRTAAANVVSLLPASELEPAGNIAASNRRTYPELRLEGEPLSIPYRVYNAEPERLVLEHLDDQHALVVSCIYTRHHDGFIRQECVSRILRSEDPCVIPFVVQLLGEYVLEICADIERFVRESLPSRPTMRHEFATFLAENPYYAALMEQRATSYWSVYYRRRHPSRQTYPGLSALDALRKVR
jgi:hypothetical protein